MVDRLKPLWEKYHTKGFEILGVGANSNDTFEKQIQYSRSIGAKWVKLFDADRDVMTKYNVRAFPTMVLVGKDGKIVFANAYRNWAQVEKYVAENCTEEVPDVAPPGSDAEVRRRLNDDGPDLSFADTPLSDVVKYLAEKTLIPMTADADAQAILDAESANITLTDGKLKNILDLLAATHGLQYEVRDKGIHFSIPEEAKPVEEKYEKGSDEYAKFMEVAKMVLPRGHKALDANSVTAAIGEMRDRNRDKMERMMRHLADRASGDERKLLREFRDMLDTD